MSNFNELCSIWAEILERKLPIAMKDDITYTHAYVLPVCAVGCLVKYLQFWSTACCLSFDLCAKGSQTLIRSLGFQG